MPDYSTNEKQIDVNLEGLIPGNFTLTIVGLRKDPNDKPLSTLDLQLKADVTIFEIMAAIKDAGASLMTILPMFSPSEAGPLGFKSPTSLYEEPELHISVTEGNSVYDATVPGGLKVNK